MQSLSQAFKDLVQWQGRSHLTFSGGGQNDCNVVMLHNYTCFWKFRGEIARFPFWLRACPVLACTKVNFSSGECKQKQILFILLYGDAEA